MNMHDKLKQVSKNFILICLGCGRDINHGPHTGDCMVKKLGDNLWFTVQAKKEADELRDEMNKQIFGGGYMSDKPFASYEKTIEPTVIKTTHTVRIRLNTKALSVKHALDKVPNDAIVSMIIGDGCDDSDFTDVGEIVFTEEKIST